MSRRKEPDEIHPSTSQRVPTVETSQYSDMLTDDNFNEFLRENSHAFIWFFAPWCVFCQRLAPTWEQFGQKIQDDPTLNVGLAKVNCMAFAKTCRGEKVQAFPTLRWYENGVVSSRFQAQDRTVDALMAFVKEQLGDEEEEQNTDIQDVGDDDIQDVGDDHPIPLKEPPSFQDHSKMRAKCYAAGLGFGNLHHFSKASGTEFVEFGKQVRIAPKCHSESTNPRGQYNSFFRPCNIIFHAAPQEGHTRRSFNSLPTVCSWENSIAGDGGPKAFADPTEHIILDYVRGWPDECVGDFQRCYSVEKDAKIFLKHFCLQQWDIPDKATHISVDCTADKELAREHNDKGGPGDVYKQMIMANQEQERKHHLEKIAIVIGLVVFSCCCCWCFLILAYKAVFVPYLKALKKSKSDPDLQSLVKSSQAVTKDEAGTIETF